MKPVISVIVPCFQAEATLEATLRGVADQRLRNWECLIVNDGSTDASPQIAEQFARHDGRFRVLHQKNAGVSIARNTGLANASAPYLHFLDADDLVSPDAYRSFVAALDRRPSAQVGYCSAYQVIDGLGQPLAVQSTPESITYSLLLNNNFGPPASAVVRRSVIENVSGFEPSLSGLADWDFWLRIARAGGEFVRVTGTLVSYRSLSGSMSKNTRLMYRDLVRLLDFLSKPDRRITRPFSELPEQVAAHHVEKLAFAHRCFYLGCAVVAQDDAFIEELLTELDTCAQADAASASFVTEAFCFGVKFAAGAYPSLTPPELASVICTIADRVRAIEKRINHAGLMAAAIEILLAPWHEAVLERDRLLASTSYRLGRMLTRYKFW